MKPTYDEMKAVRISSKASALEYVGKGIWYLCEADIDTSGRGYYFPRFMEVDEVVGKEFHNKHDGSYVLYRDIRRIKVLPQISQAKESSK